MRKELIGAASALALIAGGALAAGGSSGSSSTSSSPSGSGSSAAQQSQQGGAMQSSRASVEKLMGKDVVGSDGEKIGEISDVILDPQSGQARQLVISSGGFLGIGEKQIAVDFQSAQPVPGKDDLRLQSLTQADVRTLPEFRYDESMTSLNRGGQQPGATSSPSYSTPSSPSQSPRSSQ